MVNMLPLFFLSISVVIIFFVAFLWFILKELAEDYWVVDDAPDEEWLKLVLMSLTVVAFAIMLSYINVPLIGLPFAISLNLTGVLIPIGITIYVIVRRKVEVKAIAIAVPILALVAFCTTGEQYGSTYIGFPGWLIPVFTAALLGFTLARTKDYWEMATIAFCSASIGMLIGGDLVRVPSLISSGGSVALGNQGILDFIFLIGVASTAATWIVFKVSTAYESSRKAKESAN